MRILIINPYSIEVSGFIIFANRLQNELTELGIDAVLAKIERGIDENVDPRIFAFQSEKEELNWIENNIRSYDRIIWGGFFQQETYRQKQIVSSSQYRQRFGKKIFYFWERTGYNDPVPESHLLRLLLQNGADGFIALNDLHVYELQALGIEQTKVHQITPGVDTYQEFIPLHNYNDKINLKKSFGFPLNKAVVLSVGRFTARKRSTFLAKAWHEYDELRRVGHLVFYGSGFEQSDSTESELRNIARNDPDIEIINYENDRDRVPIYQAADVFVTAGILEGEPTVLSEAMACGLPIVASDIAGHRKLVVTGETGLLFKPDDILSLTENLIKIISHRTLRKKLSLLARKKVTKERDISIIAQKTINVVLM